MWNKISGLCRIAVLRTEPVHLGLWSVLTVQTYAWEHYAPMRIIIVALSKTKGKINNLMLSLLTIISSSSILSFATA